MDVRITEPERGMMQTFPCNVVHKDTASPILAMLDSGSAISCIDEEASKRLGCKKLTRKTTKALRYLDRKVPIDTRCVEVILQNSDATVTETLICWTIPDLAVGTRVCNWAVQKDHFPHLKHLDLPNIPKDARIELLIGTNYPDMFIPLKYKKGKPGNPFAVKTKFGWTILGAKLDKSVPRNRHDLGSYRTWFADMGYCIAPYDYLQD